MILNKKKRINIAPAKGVWGVEPHRGFESLRFRQDCVFEGLHRSSKPPQEPRYAQRSGVFLRPYVFSGILEATDFCG